MQALTQALVDVNDHRVFLFRIEVVGLQQQSFQRHAVSIFETDQLAGAPIELPTLSVAAADLFQILKIRAGHPDIRKLVKARSGQHQHVGILRFSRIVEIFCTHHELFGQAAIDSIAIKTGIARLFVFRVQQQRLRRID